jgi:hypothetical protein
VRKILLYSQTPFELSHGYRRCRAGGDDTAPPERIMSSDIYTYVRIARKIGKLNDRGDRLPAASDFSPQPAIK